VAPGPGRPNGSRLPRGAGCGGGGAAGDRRLGRPPLLDGAGGRRGRRVCVCVQDDDVGRFRCGHETVEVGRSGACSSWFELCPGAKNCCRQPLFPLSTLKVRVSYIQELCQVFVFEHKATQHSATVEQVPLVAATVTTDRSPLPLSSPQGGAANRRPVGRRRRRRGPPAGPLPRRRPRRHGGPPGHRLRLPPGGVRPALSGCRVARSSYSNDLIYGLEFRLLLFKKKSRQSCCSESVTDFSRSGLKV